MARIFAKPNYTGCAAGLHPRKPFSIMKVMNAGPEARQQVHPAKRREGEE
jgi:hypothetical protein